MTAILRTALVAALAASFIPAVAAGQDSTTASLVRRVALLELANTDLARRVRVLEALVKSEPLQGQPIPNSTKWRDLANWRRLRIGMSMNEVRTLLGEPEHVDGGPVSYWRWPNANVYFINDEVAGWEEPGR